MTYVGILYIVIATLVVYAVVITAVLIAMIRYSNFVKREELILARHDKLSKKSMDYTL